MKELKGKKAFVTGGSRGIGRAICLELARRGADVAFDYQGPAAQGEAVVRELAALGRRARCAVVDAADTEAVESCVEAAASALGGLDILVNNAGITADAVLWKMTESQFDDVIAVNLKGTFNHIRAAAPRLRKAGGGRIVNISSINGLRGKFGQANYCASKAGVIGLTKAAARELGASGVTVNCVAPGMIETEMAAGVPEEVRAKALAETLLGRLGRPEDVAHTVAFLCGDGARHITGVVIQVDGGQYL
ncbi:MAG: beta-ketoacyl-ACP reductase [Elusimicrobia bacterium GWC2_65_9]|nr:MAG: beta-ketoacyl-ACP reductase [Elusimicrobia bacterium GWA2_66_18]OGR72151.1 MAG: beta-ketoacyl-ACP reductase [Elusimicrobia bacterium GWC2_65_9]